MIIEHLIILAIIQGITEFIPVSSSAHLILFPNLISFDDQGLVIDVAVHFGSLLAVCIYLWREILFMFTGSTFINLYSFDRYRLFILILIGSSPLIFVGYFINNYNLNWIRSIETIAWCTLIFGLLLYVSDNFFLRVKNIKDINLKSSLIIGLIQILAFLPGTSRSGIVITISRILGFDRPTALKFSLLLSIPAILGATALKSFEVYNLGDYQLGKEFIFSCLISFIISFVSIVLMMRWLKFSTFTPFVIYRIFLGTILLLAVYLW